MTNQIIFDYLNDKFDTPIAKVNASLSSIHPSKNCLRKESSYPKRCAFCVGAKVMLLKIFVVEWNLMNGAIGEIKEIIYENGNGPNHQEMSLPAYIIVDFKNCTIPDNIKCFDDKPRTYIPIPVVTERCEKKCCSISTILLRVCIAVTIHKSQGMSIGENEDFEYVIIHLPAETAQRTPGQEYVALSRPKTPLNFAIANKQSEVSNQYLKKIGTDRSSQLRKTFFDDLKLKQQESQQYFKDKISSIHVQNNGNAQPAQPSFECGCAFLLQWFESLV